MSIGFSRVGDKLPLGVGGCPSLWQLCFQRGAGGRTQAAIRCSDLLLPLKNSLRSQFPPPCCRVSRLRIDCAHHQQQALMAVEAIETNGWTGERCQLTVKYPPPPPLPPRSPACDPHFVDKFASLACILQAVHDARIFDDAKTIIDMPLNAPLEEILEAFSRLPVADDGRSVCVGSLKSFLEEHFSPAGSDLQPCRPADYVEDPVDFLPDVEDERVRKWALDIHRFWLRLCRRVSDRVRIAPLQHTLLPLPHPVLIPGERFREVYYWDSYWTIKGLLVSKMEKTASGVVENLIEIGRRVGFVPNGARSYYLNRSQPPMLSRMVREVFEATGDQSLVLKALPVLQQEHEYWTTWPHGVSIEDECGQIHSLSRYHALWNQPRPEEHGTDRETAGGMTELAAAQFYCDVASAAESGWDFSSRWCEDPLDLRTLRTTRIVPADLNGLLFQMEMDVAFLAGAVNAPTVAAEFSDAAARRCAAIDSLLWNEEKSQWFDLLLLDKDEDDKVNGMERWRRNQHLRVGGRERAAAGDEISLLGSLEDNDDDDDADADAAAADDVVHDTINRSRQQGRVFRDACQTDQVYASNFVPLWCRLISHDKERVRRVIRALEMSDLIHPGGIATSLVHSGEQWDFPNAWAPLQDMIICGLAESRTVEGKRLARELSGRWLRSNLVAFEKTGHMHEKYDVRAVGAVGGGGEYTPQVGFGWSNGVALSLLKRFGTTTSWLLYSDDDDQVVEVLEEEEEKVL
ncbi:hypothetical protein CBR_g24063 [Chara braunii]|uniref:Trehalase n=1 Tax=Chara braunii TaxID=69332 RepID=A0A388L5P0_CHABU|nr:hypothetical protein CBR_g24063 [Chara braunii]|eukprot:GBG77617.1 hypothetical protein CBR_g24063 [Chara braunii]